MPVVCPECDKSYSTQFNLNKHIRTVHNKEPKYVEYACDTKYLCIACSINFKFNNDLRKHLVDRHNFENIVDQLHFESFTAFTQWLSEEQNNNKVQYVRNAGKKPSTHNFEKIYFECRRSYRKESHVLDKYRKRSLKSQGYCKLEKSCVSQIIVKRNSISNECFVTYYKSHYLHDTSDIQHLQISKQEKEMIVSKLILGVPPKGVLNSTREAIGDEIKRVDLLTRKDIRNIKVSYKIDLKDGCRHHDDANSVDIWVKECLTTNSNPVIFYKPQGQTSSGFQENDFCLIIMNKVQRKILTDFGNKIITIDGTHGLNAYDFELTTLLTLDENRQGFPVAFMFSNRKDTGIYLTFFSEIKNIIGPINTEIFMSDITDTYFKAWLHIMGPIKKRLLCSWHIDRAWQSNLMKILNTEKKSWVYKTIKHLQSLLDINDFEKKISEFVQTLLEDKDTNNFGQYIKTYYLPIKEEWAYCYRTGCGLNTNMHIESFHKTIKYHYLEGKKIKRLDKSIHQLMLFLRDKTVERIIYLKKGKTLENTIVSSHRLAITLNFALTQEDLNSWTLENIHSNKLYRVTNVSSAICCSIKCAFCTICVHMYSCTCMDFVIKTTICKHIHYVVLNKSMTMPDHGNIPDVSCVHPKENVDLEVTKLTSELITSNNNNDKIKDKIRSNLFQVFQSLETGNLSNDQLKLILSNSNTCVALSNINQNKFEIKEKSIRDEPANKKVLKQKSFCSTKKKKSLKTAPLSKASAEELKVLEEFVNDKPIISSDRKNDHNYI